MMGERSNGSHSPSSVKAAGERTLVYPGCIIGLVKMIPMGSNWPSCHISTIIEPLFCTGIPQFFCVLLYCASQTLHYFYKLKVRPSASKNIMTHFLMTLSLLWWPPNWQYLQDIDEFTKHSGRQKYLIY